MSFKKVDLRSWILLRLTGIGGALCLASVLPFGSRFLWYLEIPGHFRVQLALGLLVCSLSLCGLKRWGTALLFFLAAMLNASVLLPYYLNQPPPPEDDHPSFRLLLFNVNSTSGNPDLVREYLMAEEFDVVILQEFSARWKHALRAVPYPYRVVEVREDNFGLALLSRYPLNSSELLYVTGDSVPSIRAEVQVGDAAVDVLAIHPVPPVRKEYVQRRNRMLEEVSRLPVSGERYVIAGDFNTTPWSPESRQIGKRKGMKHAADGFGFSPTWPAMLPVLSTILDQVLSRGLTVTDYRVSDHALGSDHRPVEVTFEIR